MITGINELKTLKRQISCEFKCRFEAKKCNSNQWWNDDKRRCECKQVHYVWNPATYFCENGKYSASIEDNSMISCDKVIKSNEEEIKTIAGNFNEKKVTCRKQNFYILLAV